MGLDFIQKAAPSYKRTWRAGREKLDQAGIFTRYAEEQRTVVADSENGGEFALGKKYIMRVTDKGLILHEDEKAVGSAKCTADVKDAIKDLGGYARGVVVGLHPLSGTADVRLE